MHFADKLRRDWPALRETDKLDVVVPSCATRQWVLDRGQVGYVTLDYKVHLDVRLVEAGKEAPALVEHYWSVRTLNGRQDENWLPSLNINVVHVHGGIVTAADVENALLNAVALRLAAGSQGWFRDDAKAQLYVRAVMLGNAIGQDAAIIGGLETSQGVQLRIARFRFSESEGFVFEAGTDEERFWRVGRNSLDELRDLGARLLGDDQLPASGFQWQGTNEGPTLDGAARVNFPKGARDDVSGPRPPKKGIRQDP